MGITDPDILRAERFGSREYEVTVIGFCSHCGRIVKSDETEAYCVDEGRLFCCSYCLEEESGIWQE